MLTKYTRARLEDLPALRNNVFQASICYIPAPAEHQPGQGLTAG